MVFKTSGIEREYKADNHRERGTAIGYIYHSDIILRITSQYKVSYLIQLIFGELEIVMKSFRSVYCVR